MKMQLIFKNKINIISQRIVQKQLELEKLEKEKYNNRFYQYANDFWNQYKSIHPSFQSRRVKIYADSQDKIFIPLCKMIYPLYNVRGIDSPYHALRMCSLIPYSKDKLNGKNILKRFNSLLASNQGTIQDHCHLLCSLLLGYGLNSYIAIGNTFKGQHSWIITIDSNNKNIICWQCLKGLKYSLYSTRSLNYYKNIHTLYNNKQFYANIQLDDSISGIKFQLNNSQQWKQMNIDLIKNLYNYNVQITMMKSNLNNYKIQQQIEKKLLNKILKFRKQYKLSFNIDQKMGSILTTALSNYQLERTTGNTFCQKEFQNAIKNYIQNGNTFQAFPIQLTTLNVEQAMKILLQQPKCKQIMLVKGDSIHYAVKCKLTIFPDNIFALWVSIAIRYYKLI